MPDSIMNTMAVTSKVKCGRFCGQKIKMDLGVISYFKRLSVQRKPPSEP